MNTNGDGLCSKLLMQVNSFSCNFLWYWEKWRYLILIFHLEIIWICYFGFCRTLTCSYCNVEQVLMSCLCLNLYDTCGSMNINFFCTLLIVQLTSNIFPHQSEKNSHILFTVIYCSILIWVTHLYHLKSFLN